MELKLGPTIKLKQASCLKEERLVQHLPHLYVGAAADTNYSCIMSSSAGGGASSAGGAPPGDETLEHADASSSMPQAQTGDIESAHAAANADMMGPGNLDREFSSSLSAGKLHSTTTTTTRSTRSTPGECDTTSSTTAGAASPASTTQSQVRRQHDRRQGGPIGRRPNSRRSNSLELRKVPDHILLTARSAIMDELESQSSRGMGGSDVGGGGKKRRSSSKVLSATHGCLHKALLNPKYSLRKQMMLTFGSVSALTIVVVMVVAIIASVLTGNSIKAESAANVETWVKQSLGTTARYVAETVSPRLMPTDVVQIMYEVARDRFAGYPTTEDDSDTPFFDTISQTNVYPLSNPPLPLDWDFRHTPDERVGNVNEANYEEHVQDRWSWFSANPRLSTALSLYTMQGACNPRSTNANDMEFYPNCTDANNDIRTGGVIQPSPTNAQVARKAADLSPFLKALFEYHQDIKELGYYFSNSGAGSSIMFPHYEIDGRNSYTSVGCDWMRAPNPIDPNLGPIGTEEEIARCHPEGTEVLVREYNPLERGWCRDQALRPDRVQNIGPFRDAWNPDNWLMLAGRSIYDIKTGAFIACILVDFTIEGVNHILDAVKVDEWSMLSLVRYDESGTVVASPNFDLDTADGTTTIDDSALETGVDSVMFQEIKSLVNFLQPWDADEARQLFEETLFESDDGSKFISAFPIPAIPDEYDPNYYPEFLTIISLATDEGLEPIVDHVGDEVDNSVRNLIIFTVALGFAGLVVIFCLIFCVLSWLTEPLKWMNDVGDQVVGKFGEDLDTGINYERKKTLPFSPETELSGLTSEFSKMVSRFSGEGTAANSARSKEAESKNIFNLSDKFSDLYQSRKDAAFAYDYTRQSSAVSTASPTSEEMLERQNFGQNFDSGADTASIHTPTRRQDYDGTVAKSPLFWWILGLIVTPLLIVAVSISTVVLVNISTELPSLIIPVKEEYLVLRNATRFSATSMRAIQASQITEKSARDNHLLTRFASWLLFDGMGMSNSFTELLEGAEECKTSSAGSQCPWMANRLCDCAWNDIGSRNTGKCTSFEPGASRPLQKLHFEAQNQDTDIYGTRLSTSFPNVASSPAATSWWNNTSALPRLRSDVDNSTGTRYVSTYGRVRVLSALSSVLIPLYNYDTSDDKPFGMYIGYEADGMLAGYTGCDYSFATFPFFMSSESNGASKLRPELCPIGKYGYDARCRGWYADSKSGADAGEGNLHITPPYVFAQAELFAQSASTPLIDPRTQTYVGQSLVDLIPSSIFTSLESDNTKLAPGGFPILVTSKKSVLGTDTLVGPDFSLGSGEGKAIEELVLPYDELYCEEQDPKCTAWKQFEPILNEMKEGNAGSSAFTRTGPSGAEEVIDISYAPVFVKHFRALDSSDLSRGVEREDILIYSLALAETEKGITQSFQSIDQYVKTEVNVCIAVLSVLIFFSAILIIYIAYRVTSSMIRPILNLVIVVEDINRQNLNDDDITMLSEHKGSCREVDSVYETMEMLYKVVRFANNAFFAGDLEKAYGVLKDSLKLFIRLNNKKAIAVASNNLGNTMLTMYRTMAISGDETMCGLSKKDIVAKGTAYHAHAIKLGEEAYDLFYNEQGWSEECLSFMQFLANRYFNRAMFLLTVKDDHAHPKEAESMGFRDLQITSDMDVEIVDQCLEMGFKIDRVERYDLMMSRVRGLLALTKLGYSVKDLEIDEHVKCLFRDLKNALENPGHELFETVSPAGRMQKLDVELIKYLLQAKEDATNAARVAIRMLVEDEYISCYSQQEAYKALLLFMNKEESEDDDHKGYPCRPHDEDGGIKMELKTCETALEVDFNRRARSSFALYRMGSSGRGGNSFSNMRSMRGKFDSSERKIETSPNDDAMENDGSDTQTQTEKWMKRISISTRESTRGDVTMESF